MIKVGFVKSSINHSKMHERFRKHLKDSNVENVVFESLDFDRLINEKIYNPLFLRVLNVIFLGKALALVGRIQSPSRFFLLSTCRKIIKSKLISDDFTHIVISDNYFSFANCMMLSVCKEIGLEAYCIPFVNQDIEDIYISRLENSRVRSFSRGVLAHIICNFFPHWVANYNGERLLWANPFDIYSIYRMRGNFFDPVSGVGNHVRFVFVSSELARSRFVSYGVNASKLKIIGDIIYDGLFFGNGDFKNPSRKPTILFSVCPELNKKCVYGSYEEYLRNYATCLGYLSECGFRVIITLHPSTKSNVKAFFDEELFEFLADDVSIALGKSDIYISSYSSTMMLAAEFGLTVFDDDIYDLGYVGNKNNLDIGSISGESGLQEFSEFCLDFLKNERYKDPIIQGELFDGRVLYRFLDYLK
jgi:hypothetical protein